MTTRRRFLQLSGLSLLASRASFAIEPFQRGGAARLQLSLAAYSFRESFKDQQGKTNPAGTLDMFAFVDYSAEHGCDGAELTSYYFPSDVTDDYLRQVRRHAFLRGVSVSGTSVGNTFTHPPGPARDKEIALVKRWVDRAAVLGTSHIRVFAGGAAKDQPRAEAVKNCIAALEECAEYAGQHGVFLGIENHGGIVAEPTGLLEIIKAVKSPWVGVNLDTGNFHGADPYAELATCAPYAVNVQIKSEIRRAGAKENEAADLARVVKILRDANYQGWVALEYEAKEDPWKAVPPLLAQLRELVPAPSPPAVQWTPLFDGKSLTGWKLPDFSGSGEVEVKDGAIVLDMGNDLTGINYTGEVPHQNYEVAFEAQRQEGNDFFCALTFPVGESHCTFVVGGWGGALVGISSINGEDASENETSEAKKFEKGRWYKIRVRVTKERLETWIDDEQMVDLELEGKRIAMRPGEIESSKPFGIATYRTRGAVRDIRLRKL
ncbi:MAG TPA: TIM barrel protein [Chthoniobacteraceae bacterium]|jgi:sugar phosphate isomerase/epimerase|nr:TIM barrel protein [Chthoniobacteraceae bacterium]